MTIALAQSRPIKGDIDENIQAHCRFVEQAALQGADLIAFPELSITGYEPDLARGLKFHPDDSRLSPLVKRSQTHQMTIVAGTPIQIENKLHIGAFVICPDEEILIYTKHHLHQGEAKYFVSGTRNPKIIIGKDGISLAICADITHSIHAENAFHASSTIYLSSVFITEKGYATDSGLLQQYASQFAMDVFMANFCGASGGHVSAGKSAAWNREGKLISTLGTDSEGLLIASKTSDGWHSKHLYF